MGTGMDFKALYDEEIDNAKEEGRPVNFQAVNPEEFLQHIQSIPSDRPSNDYFIMHLESQVTNYMSMQGTKLHEGYLPDDITKFLGFDNIPKHEVVFSALHGATPDSIGSDSHIKYYQNLPLTPHEQIGKGLMDRNEPITMGDLTNSGKVSEGEYLIGFETYNYFEPWESTKLIRNIYGVLGRDYQELKPFLHPPEGKDMMGRYTWAIDIPILPYYKVEGESIEAKEKPRRTEEEVAEENKPHKVGTTSRATIISLGGSLDRKDDERTLDPNKPFPTFRSPKPRERDYGGNKLISGRGNIGGFLEKDLDDHKVRFVNMNAERFVTLAGVDRKYLDEKMINHWKKKIADGQSYMPLLSMQYDPITNQVQHSYFDKVEMAIAAIEMGIENVPVVVQYQQTTSDYGQRQFVEDRNHPEGWTQNRKGLPYDTDDVAYYPEVYQQFMGKGWQEGTKEQRDKVGGEKFWRANDDRSRMSEKEEENAKEIFFLKSTQKAAGYAHSIALEHGGFQIASVMSIWDNGGSKFPQDGIVMDQRKRKTKKNTFTEEDVNVLMEKFNSVEHKGEFDRALDKFYKMLNLNPTLKEEFEKADRVFEDQHNRTHSQLYHGGIRKLHRGTTLQDGANIMGDEGGEYGDEPRIRKTIKAGRGGRAVFDYISTTISPDIAMNDHMPFDGLVCFEFGVDQLQQNARREHTGIWDDKLYNKQKEEVKQAIKEWEKKNPDKLEERGSGKMEMPFGLQLDLERKMFPHIGERDRATKPSRKKYKGGSLRPVRYTVYPTPMLGENPEEKLWGMEKIDTDMPANMAKEMEVRLPIGMSAKNAVEGVIINLGAIGNLKELLTVLGKWQKKNYRRQHFRLSGQEETMTEQEISDWENRKVLPIGRKPRSRWLKRLVGHYNPKTGVKEHWEPYANPAGFDKELNLLKAEKQLNGYIDEEALKKFLFETKVVDPFMGDPQYGHTRGESNKVSLWKALDEIIGRYLNLGKAMRKETHPDKSFPIPIRYKLGRYSSPVGNAVRGSMEDGSEEVEYKTFNDLWSKYRRNKNDLY